MNISRSRSIGLALAIFGMTMAGSQIADAGGALRQASAVYNFVGGEEMGNATLHRNAHGVTTNIATTVGGQLDEFGTHLDAYWRVGDATTVWFVVFSDPAGCIDGCGEDDVLDAIFGDNRADVGVFRAAGKIAGSSTFRASGRLNEGDTDELLLGVPMMDAMTAEVHLVVHPHGPAANLSGQELAAALHSVDGGCETNTCGDAQFAVFAPPAG